MILLMAMRRAKLKSARRERTANVKLVRLLREGMESGEAIPPTAPIGIPSEGEYAQPREEGTTD